MPKDSFYSWVHDTEYWDEQESVLLKIIYPDLQDTLSKGLDIGFDEVFSFGGSPEAVLGEAWNIINRKAVAYANMYSYDLVKGITQTTREYLQEVIPGWIAGSDPLSALIHDPGLVAMFGPVRANMIATTEITRAFAQGNMMVWQNCDWVKGARWMTAMDELVCDICGQLDYKWVSFESGGFVYGTEVSVETVEAPPAHVNCRCWILPVTQGNADATPGTEQGDVTPTLPDAPPEGLPGTEPPPTGYVVDEYGNPMVGSVEDMEMLSDKFLIRGESIWDEDVRGAAKDKIVREISQRTGIPYQDVNDLIHQWAATSNDSDKTSMDIQRVAAKLFNTEMSPWQQSRFDSIGGSNFLENHYTGELKKTLLDLGFKDSDEVLEKFLTSMYEYTQEQFSAAGITEITVQRGIDLPWSVIDKINEVSSVGKTIALETNALESWTFGADTAAGFAENGRGALVVQTNISVKRIIGTCRTGFGCLTEEELVMVGGKKYTGKELFKIIKIGRGSSGY